MLIVQLVSIIFGTLMAVFSFAYWRALRNPKNSVFVYWSSRSERFRRFQVIFLPLMFLNFIAMIFNGVRGFYLLLQ